MRNVKSKNLIKNSKKSAQNAMENFLNKICIDESCWEIPLELNSDSDLSLNNPYSAVSCWVLYLYSMELGSPPLYLELNRTSRNLDRRFLSQLGPFALALLCVCVWGDYHKKEEDRILPDQFLGGGYLTGCFILWRGVPMEQEWIQDYVDNVGEEVRISGNNSYSRNLTVALKFAFKDQGNLKKPVLFLLLKGNYSGHGSVMLNGEAYSSYPSEGEMLLYEGAPVRILGFEEKVMF